MASTSRRAARGSLARVRQARARRGDGAPYVRGLEAIPAHDQACDLIIQQLFQRRLELPPLRIRAPLQPPPGADAPQTRRAI